MKVNSLSQNNQNFGLLYMDKDRIARQFGPSVADQAESIRYYLEQKADVVDIIVNPETNAVEGDLLGVYIQDVTPRKSLGVKNPVKRFILTLLEDQQIAAKMNKNLSQKAEVFITLGNIAGNIRNKVDMRLEILHNFRDYMAQFNSTIPKRAYSVFIG